MFKIIKYIDHERVQMDSYSLRSANLLMSFILIKLRINLFIHQNVMIEKKNHYRQNKKQKI
jgi:hypothetical protein